MIHRTECVNIQNTSNGKWLLVFTFFLLIRSGISDNVFAQTSDLPTGCSIFTISIGDTVFFGNNEDS
jgi:hypothetical protein